MSRHEYFSGLSASELERLAILSEEMGEVIQVIGKIMRHGYESRNPLDHNSKSNRELLEKECGDVMFILKLMGKAEDIDEVAIDMHSDAKAAKIIKYLHHQPKALIG